MKIFYRLVLVLIAFIVYVLPAMIFFATRGGFSFLNGLDFSGLSYALFPLLGLYAFSMLWLQFIMGSARDVLAKAFPRVLKFHMTQGSFVLLFALIHPLLLAIGVGLENYLSMQYVTPELKIYAYLGIIALFLMIIAVTAAKLRMHPWLQKRWLYFHYLNYVVFILAWMHSWALGTDIQTAPYKQIWLFYGITAIVAILARLQRMVRERRQLAAVSR